MERIFFTSLTEEDLKDIFTQCIREEFAKIKPPPDSSKSLAAHLKVKDLTMLLGVSKVTIGQWIKKGILKAYKLGNKRIYFKREEVEELLKQKEVPMKHMYRFKEAAKELNSQTFFKTKAIEKDWGTSIENIDSPASDQLKGHNNKFRNRYHD